MDDDRYSVDKRVEDFEWLGYSKTTLKSDNEPAIAQVLKEVLESLKVVPIDQAMEEHPAPYDSKANGAVESAVKQVQSLMRMLEIVLGRGISKSIPLDHPVVARLVEHAAFILATRRVTSNGPTAYQHLRGRQFIKSLVCLSARCLQKRR